MEQWAVLVLVLVVVVAVVVTAVVVVRRRTSLRADNNARHPRAARDDLRRAGDRDFGDSPGATRNGPVSFLAPGGNGGRG